uniref:Reverse transcriptase Ty1/copia-type domain-containing protein n=1 Tax=Peronospora matthiolae TaxID=2874970 RepID=A0AAV1T4L7_9STRA
MRDGHVPVLKYKDKTCTVVGVYADDLLVTGTEKSAVNAFSAEVSLLSIKDLVVVNKFLGLRIQLDGSNGSVLDQEVTIDLLLKEFGMESANGVRTPTGDERNEDNEDDLDYLPTRSAKCDSSVKTFQSLVGSLLWIERCKRPDICFAVHKATRQTHKPTSKDWKTSKRILRYLKISKGLKFHLNGVGSTTEDIRIECWSDADFAADKADSKSGSGCVLTMDSAVFLW